MDADPTLEEMLAFLIETFGDDADDFDRMQAIYWFASDYHGGQSSNLYSVLSTCEYKPGCNESGPEHESMAEDCYLALESEYFPFAR